MEIRVNICGRHYHRAEKLPRVITVAEGSSLDQLLQKLQDQLGDSPLPKTALVILSGRHLGTLVAHRSAELRPDDELTILIPMAGG